VLHALKVRAGTGVVNDEGLRTSPEIPTRPEPSRRLPFGKGKPSDTSPPDFVVPLSLRRGGITKCPEGIPAGKGVRFLLTMGGFPCPRIFLGKNTASYTCWFP